MVQALLTDILIIFIETATRTNGMQMEGGSDVVY
jgi:hypothetical protein